MGATTRSRAAVTTPQAGCSPDSLGLPVIFTGSGIAALLAAGVFFVAILGRRFDARPLLEGSEGC